MTKGGIFPCIMGTFLLELRGHARGFFPCGVASAIYLSEYARPGPMLRVIRLGINNLAGVPSVVFGLFGLAFFVTWLELGVSVLSGILTLGVLILPVIIGTAEEALRSVPATYREASLALGGTKWQTIYRVVLPAAFPGMLTGSTAWGSAARQEKPQPSCLLPQFFFTRHLSDLDLRSSDGPALSCLRPCHGGNSNRSHTSPPVRNSPGSHCSCLGNEFSGHRIACSPAKTRMNGQTKGEGISRVD